MPGFVLQPLTGRTRGSDGHQQEQPERDGGQEHVGILRVQVGDLAGNAAVSQR